MCVLVYRVYEDTNVYVMGIRPLPKVMALKSILNCVSKNATSFRVRVSVRG